MRAPHVVALLDLGSCRWRSTTFTTGSTPFIPDQSNREECP
ncbi:hypothetical protein [Planomonospora alba]